MLQRKILIVDDEEHICELIGFNLRKSGYKTIAANDGLSGLKIARRENLISYCWMSCCPNWMVMKSARR